MSNVSKKTHKGFAYFCWNCERTGKKRIVSLVYRQKQGTKTFCFDSWAINIHKISIIQVHGAKRDVYIPCIHTYIVTRIQNILDESWTQTDTNNIFLSNNIAVKLYRASNLSKKKISENSLEISSFSNQSEMNRSQWKALLSQCSRAEKLISSGVCLERKPGSCLTLRSKQYNQILCEDFKGRTKKSITMCLKCCECQCVKMVQMSDIS